MGSSDPGAAPRRVHGGPDPDELRALGIAAGELVDFSVNVNPYGPSPTVAAAARGAELTRYPDPEARAVRVALAARWRREPAEVLFAHGATEILWDLARHLARAGTRTLIVEPAFGELAAALEANGAPAVKWRPEPGAGAPLDVEAVSGVLAAAGAHACTLASPTSPLGLAVPPADVERLAHANPEVIFVLDESFLSLSDVHADADRPLPPNVARLRSLTKEHALPGLRVGYLLAGRSLVAALEAARPAWATSAPAQAAALAAVAEEGFVEESRRRLAADREALRQGLERLGLAPSRSVAPYLAFQVEDAAVLRRRLLARRLLVRDCASFGLPGVVRVAARPAPDLEALLGALAREL